VAYLPRGQPLRMAIKMRLGVVSARACSLCRRCISGCNLTWEQWCIHYQLASQTQGLGNRRQHLGRAAPKGIEMKSIKRFLSDEKGIEVVEWPIH